jgi:DNA topoisomerase-1
MMKTEESLVIVESPTKAKTISKILGSGFTIVSSMGHLIDLPKKKLGIDIEHNFEPEYVVVPGRLKILNQIKREARDKRNIYIATDPDREGEAIGWQIMRRLPADKRFLRVVFHEITPLAIKQAFKDCRDFDLNMLNAQIARRILDRLVGYFLSPLLWRKIVRGLSAGRVQSVTLRLIVERERQIQKFKPQEYWEIEAQLCKSPPPPAARLPDSQAQVDIATRISFLAKLEKIEGKGVRIDNKEQAESLVNQIKQERFIVAQIKQTLKKRNPPAPFITSTLQQEAFNKLKFTSAKTMILAQQLYEGIEIEQGSPVGLITYMRTDSVYVANEAIKQARQYILNNFGDSYLPQRPNIYKTKKLAQGAHEAIRPTFAHRPAEDLKDFLTADQFKLYKLIYDRFIASQMTPMQYKTTKVYIKAGRYQFCASGVSIIFEGFAIIYRNQQEKETLPVLKEGEVLELIKLNPSQHFTKPPARFSEGSLVKTLEEHAIGRPSTYAPIIQTIVERDYVRRQNGYFFATELGFKVCDLLVEYFPKVMDVKFTARMEEDLDRIEQACADRLEVIKDFYEPFKASLEFAQRHIKKEVIVTDVICDKCGSAMVIKWGRRGKFLSCSGFPKCKNAKSITTGVKCPQQGCDGELIERRWRRGMFFGCSKFPRCRYTTKKLPPSP